jgi:hypothetical protein
MDETDRDGVEEVQLLPTAAPAHNEAGLLEQAEMLGHGDPRHVVAGGQSHQGLAVPLEESVEQGPPSRIGKRAEHRLHDTHNRKPDGFLSTGAGYPSRSLVVNGVTDVGRGLPDVGLKLSQPIRAVR